MKQRFGFSRRAKWLALLSLCGNGYRGCRRSTGRRFTRPIDHFDSSPQIASRRFSTVRLPILVAHGTADPLILGWRT